LFAWWKKEKIQETFLKKETKEIREKIKEILFFLKTNK